MATTIRNSIFVVLLFFLITLLQIVHCVDDIKKTFSQDLTPTLLNPLRGFVSYEDSYKTNKFPQSLEYSYVAMKDLMSSLTTFTFTPLETYLNNVKSRKRQAIFRIYLDYPNCCPDGTYASGVPDFLLTGTNPVTFTTYAEYSGGKSPNYSNERLIQAIEVLLQQLAKSYDGDNRIAYIQLGLLGYWGEWHTFPNTNQMAPLATRQRVYNAFYNNFNVTKLLVSQDSMGYFCPPTTTGGSSNSGCDISVTQAPYPSIAYPSIGFHDDAFADSTFDLTKGKDFFFYNRLKSRIPDINSFLTSNNGGKGGAVIGGELYPDHQSKIFKTTWTGQNFAQCVTRTNATWLLNDYVFSTLANSPTTEWYTARNASLLLGYAFTIKSVTMTSITTTSLTLKLEMENIGSAPFPYPDINLSIYLKNPSNQAIVAQTESVSIYYLNPASGSQTITMNFKWGTPITTSPHVYVNLKSKHVPSTIPISFAVYGAPTNGNDFQLISTTQSLNSTNPQTSTSSLNPKTSSSVKKDTSQRTSEATIGQLSIPLLLISLIIILIYSNTLL